MSLNLKTGGEKGTESEGEREEGEEREREGGREREERERKMDTKANTQPVMKF